MTTTELPPLETLDAGFHAVPPFMGPIMEALPEYGSITDPGTFTDLGGGLRVFSSNEITFRVNTLSVLTSEGVVVLDSQMLPHKAQAVIDDIAAHTNAPIKYVTNSHHHPDHFFGNPTFAQTGAELVSSYFTARMIDGSGSADLLVMAGMYGEFAPPSFAVPKTTFVRSKELWLGKTVVQLFEFADSTTVSGEAVNMTLAWLPEQKVLHAADTLEPGTHAFFSEGVSVPDWLVQLGHLRELCRDLGPKVIVPGHGAPGDIGMIDAQEHYLRTVAKIVEDHTRGGSDPLDDETCAALRSDIIAAFPEHTNLLPLDLSLGMMQMLGPVAFLTGRPDAETAARLPSFR